MKQDGNQTETLTLSQLLHEGLYVIPLYQRNFAWSDREVEQLLRDVEENNNERYYIGTLVVSEGEKNGKPYFEVIDGQQRLTAVNIIYSVLAKKCQIKERCELNLSFESRDKSNYSLKKLREQGGLGIVEGAGDESFRQAIMTVERFAKEVLGDPCQIEQYLKEKFLKVCIFKVWLHELTDKNHYFEVMNNRGEQLEAHEIVKAKMMDTLVDEKEREVFATVWDACADMNGRLDKDNKLKHLWGENFTEDPLQLDSFEAISEKLLTRSQPETDSEGFSIAMIGKYHRTKPNPQQDNPQEAQTEMYESVIDFPNFLLQVLEIGGFKEDVRLDAAKFLLYEFGCLGEQPLPDAKTFLLKLLRLRILFDKYIIKRKRTELTGRGWKWAIERPEYKNGKQYVVNTFDKYPVDADEVDDTDEQPTASKPMCMLQAMFFVTFRRDVYMRWLTKALAEVDRRTDGSTLWTALEDYSVRFIWESRKQDGVEKNEYKKGCATHRYVFNYLDYQLWYLYYCKVAGVSNPDIEKYGEIMNMIDNVRIGFQYFIFTRRNSVEHYLAQEKGHFRGIKDEVIDDFGNLSLISGGLNSKLSNRECSEKKEYHDLRNPASLKYELMLAEPEWGVEEIKRHGKLMVELLRDKSDGYFDAYGI